MLSMHCSVLITIASSDCRCKRITFSLLLGSFAAILFTVQRHYFESGLHDRAVQLTSNGDIWSNAQHTSSHVRVTGKENIYHSDLAVLMIRVCKPLRALLDTCKLPPPPIPTQPLPPCIADVV